MNGMKTKCGTKGTEKWTGYHMKRKLIPYLFVAPAMLVLIAFKVLPICVSIHGSLFKVGARNIRHFVGLQNFINLFQDNIFYISLKNTIVFNLMTTPVEICFAFILAAVFNQNLPGIKVFRTIFYIPVCISMAMATTVWALMMNPYQGLLNTFLGYFGMDGRDFSRIPARLWAVS